MGRQKNDGRGRLGGRKKGVPNVITGDLRKQLGGGLSERVAEYFKRLDAMEDPSDYCAAFTSMAKAVLPKESSVSIETDRTIEDRLRELCEETGEE